MPRFKVLLLLLAATSCLSAQNSSPLRFIENKGQWNEGVEFKAKIPGVDIWVEQQSLTLDLLDLDQIKSYHAQQESAGHGLPSSLNHHAIRLEFPGSKQPISVRGKLKQLGRTNYYIGNNPSSWASNAKAFGAVILEDLYAGIDLNILGHGGFLKYEFILEPGSDAEQIRLFYNSALSTKIEKNELLVAHSFGSFKETAPVAFQMVNGQRVVIPCRFEKRRDGIGFRLGQYDTSKELIIDPSLIFSTYSGSTADNFGYTATYDEDGFLYSGSTSFGQGYPTTLGAYQTTHAGGSGLGSGTDIAITKYDTTGTLLIWSTYLGGSGDEMPHSLITNSNDECYVFGTTSSIDFPVSANAYSPSFNGGSAFVPNGLGVNYQNGSDMIVTRLSNDGTALIGSTYFGGSGNDGLNTSTNLRFNYADEVRGEILLDANEDVLVVSCTYSTDMPLAGSPLQNTNNGNQEGCVLKMNAALSALQWSTYLGGSGDDAAYSLDIAPNSDIFVALGTSSAGLPTPTPAVNQLFNGGTSDAYVARIASNGSSIINATYYGSPEYDQAYFVESDNTGAPHIYGQTLASNPTDLIVNAPFNSPNSGQLVAKFTNDLSALTWSTRFGDGTGAPDISPTAFLVDICNRIYVAGWGSSIQGAALSTLGLPTTSDGFQTSTDGNDFYLAVFPNDMSALTYATYFGGGSSAEHVDGGTSRFDRRGSCYQSVCAGCGGNSDFPIEPNPGAWSATNNSPNCNNGVFKFDFESPLVVASFNATDTICVNEPIDFDNTSSGGVTYSWNFGDNTTSGLVEPSHNYNSPGTYTVTLVANSPIACNLSDTAVATIVVSGVTPTASVSNDTIVCGSAGPITLTGNSFGTASNFLWSDQPDFSNQLNSSLSDSIIVVNPTVSTTYYLSTFNNIGCATVDSVVVTISLSNLSISPAISICADDTIPLTVLNADPGSTFNWSPTSGIVSGQGTNTILVNPPNTTNYTVQVNAPSGCTSSESANVTVSQLNGSTVNATATPPIIQSGNSSQLQASPTNGVSYAWSPSASLNNPNIANPVATPLSSTWYQLIITDGVCTAGDSVLVRVGELICGEPDIFVPNAFSPNGDLSNDTLFVRGNYITEMEFRVFDRWGEKVFESTELSTGWDGTYKGKRVDPAVFVYYLEVVCGDGQTFFKKGNITVVE